MRLVVDTNCLDSPALNDFLRCSEHHRVLLTDFVAIESHTSDPLTSLPRRLAILSKYPNQVLVLKNTPVLCGLSGRAAGLTRRMVDSRLTHEFEQFCNAVQLAAAGDKWHADQILEKSQAATEYLDRLLGIASNIDQWYGAFQTEFNQSEIKAIRRGEAHPESIWIKLTVMIRDVTGYLLAGNPRCHRWPKQHELPNTYLYRFSLFLHLHFLDWIKHGSSKTKKPEKFRNDLVDISIGAIATFFDGLYTEDNRLREFYDMGSYYLENYSIPVSRITPKDDY